MTYHQEGTYSRRETRVFPGKESVLGVPGISGFGFAAGGDFGTKTAKNKIMRWVQRQAIYCVEIKLVVYE